MSKQRIVKLQKSLKIASTALERISWGTIDNQSIAAEALDEMRRLEPKAPLQYLLGHERAPRRT